MKRANTRAGIMMAHKLSLHIMPMAKPAEMTERAKMMMAHKVSLYYPSPYGSNRHASRRPGCVANLQLGHASRGPGC